MDGGALMKYCMMCGNRLEESARFCDRCGARQPETDMYASSQTAAMTVEQPIAPQKRKFDWQIPKDSAGEQLTIQQYNALLAGLLLYGFALCTVICHAFAIDLMMSNPIVLAVVYLVCAFIGGYMANRSRSTAVRFIGFNLIVAPSGAIVAACLPYYHFETVLYAVLGTALIAGVMLVAALVRPQMFEGLGSVLLLSLISVIVVETILLIFFGRSSTFIDVAVIVIMAGFVGYDFIEANKAYRTAGNAIAFAIDLYLDLINIFIRLLSIFGSRE